MENKTKTFFTKTQNFILRYRRIIAATLLTTATLMLYTQIASNTKNNTTIYVANKNINSGNTIKETDITTTKISTTLTPDGTIKNKNNIVGKTTSGKLNKGEIFTNSRILNQNLLEGEPDNLIALPLQPQDPNIIEFLHPGQYINILATQNFDATNQNSTETIIEKALKILWVPPTNTTKTTQKLILVAATPQQAINLNNTQINIMLLN